MELAGRLRNDGRRTADARSAPLTDPHRLRVPAPALELTIREAPLASHR